MRNLVFFDLETSGLDPVKHEIAQIAAVAVDAFTMQELATFSTRVRFNPDRGEKQALEIIGYTPEAWEGAPAWGEVAPRFSNFLKDHATVQMKSRAGNPYYVAQLVGHNASRFDGPFLQEHFARLNAFLPGSYAVLDTYQLAQWLFHLQPVDPGPPNLRLGPLAEYLGIEVGETHDALADVKINIQLYEELVEALRTP